MTTYRVTDLDAAVPCGFDYDTAREAVDRFADLSGLRAQTTEAFGAEASQNLIDDIVINLVTREVGIGAFETGGFVVARID